MSQRGKRNTTDVAVVLQKAYEWNLWIHPHVEKFNKAYRPTLGHAIHTRSLDLLTHLTDATYQSRNEAPLAAAVREINRLRYMLRLAKDLRLLPISSHEFAANALDEMGRMSGGWLRTTRNRGHHEAGWQPVE